jgi:uncharacterized protein (PEP-CTERM system associated)
MGIAITDSTRVATSPLPGIRRYARVYLLWLVATPFNGATTVNAEDVDATTPSSGQTVRTFITPSMDATGVFYTPLKSRGRPVRIKQRPAERKRGWTFMPYLSIGETYTDNVSLAPPGFEQGDFVTELSPGLSFSRQARRYNVDVDYLLQNFIYAEDGSRNANFNVFRGIAQAELLRDQLFLDVNADSAPRNVLNNRRIGLDNIAITQNRSETLTYKVNPYWDQELGKFSTLGLSYALDKLEFASDLQSQSDSLKNSEGNTYLVTLESGRLFSRFLWDVHYRRQTINYVSAIENRFETYGGRLQYLLTRTWAVQIGGGKENDSFQTTHGNNTRGTYWTIGTTWNPSRRTSLHAVYGERFFGSTGFLELRHELKRFEWIASYARDLVLARNHLLSEQRAFPTIDVFGKPILNPITQPAVAPFFNNFTAPTQTPEVYLLDRVESFLRYRSNRHLLQFGIFDEQRKFQATGQNESILGGYASWEWTVGPYTISALRLGLATNNLRDGRVFDYKTVDLAVTWKLAPKLEARLGYGFLQRSADNSADSYDDNRAFVSLLKSF